MIIDLPTGTHSIEPSIVVSDSELPVVVNDFEPPVVMSDTELPPMWLRKKCPADSTNNLLNVLGSNLCN